MYRRSPASRGAGGRPRLTPGATHLRCGRSHTALCKGSTSTPPGDHIIQRWLGRTRGWGGGDLGRCHRGRREQERGRAGGHGHCRGGGCGTGQPGRALLPSAPRERLALESSRSPCSGSDVGCGGCAEPSVQGCGLDDAENPFWPREPERSRVPSFVPWSSLQNIPAGLGTGWLTRRGPDLQPQGWNWHLKLAFPQRTMAKDRLVLGAGTGRDAPGRPWWGAGGRCRRHRLVSVCRLYRLAGAG